MTCASCNDRGVFRVAYHDGSPSEYALCLCAAGEAMRRAKNNGKPVTPLWQVWAHQAGIPLDRIAPMEALLTDEELAARGFTELEPVEAIDAIAAAARARSPKR